MQGSRKAQRELYNAYADGMYNVAFRMVKNAEDAEDILQNAFLEVFRNLKNFRYQSTPGAWIKRIVVNKALNFLKKEQRINVVSLADQTDKEWSESNDKITYADYDIDVVKKSIDNLPQGYRIVLSLYLIEGYDHKEIGQILHISEATSKSQYSRARKKLREIIRHEINV